MKFSLRKTLVSTVVALTLTSSLAPSLIASASNGQDEAVSGSQVENIENQYSEQFIKVSETDLYDKNDGAIYHFDSAEALNQYIASPTPYNNTTNNTVVPPISATPEWVQFNQVYFTPSEAQEIANAARSNQTLSQFVTLLGTILGGKSTGAGVTVQAMSMLMYNSSQAVINAANQNRGFTVVYEQNVNWTGYGPRTRTRIVI